MKNTTPMQDKTKRVFTVYVGRKIFECYETTLADATELWSGICDDNPGVTVSLYDGYKRGLENLCCTGK